MKFSDRGLVLNGYPNLKIFNYLYWLSFLTLTINAFLIFPLSKLLKENFPENSAKGQVCSRIEFHMDETNLQQRLFIFLTPMLMTIFNLRFKKVVLSYTQSQNLKQKSFSQFGGKHQRNIFTAQHTSSYFFVSSFFIFLENFLIIAFQKYPEYIDNDSQFFLHNIIWFVFIDCFFGLYVPLKHLKQSRQYMPRLWLDEKTIEATHFYVRELEMIPRRYAGQHVPIIKNRSRIRSKAHFSYLHKKCTSHV